MTFEMLFVNSSSRQMIGICFVYVVSSFETLGWFCDWRFQYCHNLINLSRDSGLFNLYETMTFEMLFVDPSSQQMIDIFVFLSLLSVHGHRLPAGRIMAWGLARVLDLVWT